MEKWCVFKCLFHADGDCGIRENAKGGCAMFANDAMIASENVEGKTPYGREPHISLRQGKVSPAPPEAQQSVD